MPISAFSALISGICTFAEAAQWIPGVETIIHNPALNQLFYKKAMFIEEEF